MSSIFWRERLKLGMGGCSAWSHAFAHCGSLLFRCCAINRQSSGGASSDRAGLDHEVLHSRFCSDRGPAAQRTLPILDEIHAPTHQVAAAFDDRRLQKFGIRRNEIGRRKHVQPLPYGKGCRLLMVRRDAGGRVMPPLLLQ